MKSYLLSIEAICASSESVLELSDKIRTFHVARLMDSAQTAIGSKIVMVMHSIAEKNRLVLVIFELEKYKLVFITDRRQLDSQLTAIFERTQDETVHHARSVAHLKELLQRDSSDIVTAMVQKFQESADEYDFLLLNDSSEIIILADEAHRTEYGTLGVAINTARPNAPKIAFTGTPLIKSQKTNNEFGSYIDTYTIEEAVKDGATIQILYEGREAKIKVTGDSLDSLFDEYFSDRTDEEKKQIKVRFGTNRAVLEAPQRIRRVCIDILKHYRVHTAKWVQSNDRYVIPKCCDYLQRDDG